MKRIPLLGSTLARLGLEPLARESEALDPGVARRVVARLNVGRAAGDRQAVSGELLALSLLHEAAHRAIVEVARRVPEAGVGPALDAVRDQIGRDPTEELLSEFATRFPGVEATGEDRLEDLILIQVANENPAAAPLRGLIDASGFAATELAAAMRAVEHHLASLALPDDSRSGTGPLAPEQAGSPEQAGGGGSRTLLDLLREPGRHSPHSLTGQLRFIQAEWGWLLGSGLDDLAARVDQTLGILGEEERGLHRRFGGGGGGGGGPRRDPGPADRPVERPVLGPVVDGEPEAFSTDSAWMPRVVLMAKATYVWLDQLSRRYAREIRTLDAIPDETLDELVSWGVTGLWLIGLWQRSIASERIKRMRGNADAVASAYSLDDYRIADDLGGEAAYSNLRDRAWQRGIRLASDMVPNHMGIDSRWVIEHPEWFLSLPEPPYPAYTFDGPDLSGDPRAGIVLEDHYWDDSDAAVVFKRFDRASGEARYVYHGNDGTSFPWNDTAQLDFVNPVVREQVIEAILDVARRFPIIRFDAAMVLARRHVQRLWWPQPGAGDAIPSRAEHAIPKAEFDARMPAEFWREVVDRVAAEVPDTLLLAEAFWMLEGYFVRTLGMHRVYNSAFMHMLRDEDNAGYRRVIKETLEFDTEILQRFVNFMNNPDEKTAVEQFGKGDKYFGVATLLATLPGLPMLGHGQVEGFGEKYGMEFRRATLDEQPDHWLVERHEREIFPLLHRRGWFAGARDFLLYDVTADGGEVDENVFAYSNGQGPSRSLVVYHNRYGSTTGRIRESATFAVKSPDGSRSLARRTLADGLGLADGPDDALVAFRDARGGLEHLRTVGQLRDGLRVELDAYRCHVFWEFREVHDPAGVWRGLADRLGGRGVPSLEEALLEQQLEPVLAAVRGVLRPNIDEAAVRELVRAVGEATGTGNEEIRDRVVDIAARRLRGLDQLASGGQAGALEPPPPAGADSLAGPLPAGKPGRADPPGAVRAATADPWRLAIVRAWAILEPLGRLAPGAASGSTSRAWFEELRFAPAVAAALRDQGIDEAGAWSAVERIRLLLALARPSSAVGRSAPEQAARLANAWLDDPETRTFLRVNHWQDAEWFDREAWQELCDWAVVLDAVDGTAGAVDETTRRRTLAASAAIALGLAGSAERARYRVDALRDLVRPVERPRPVKPRR